MEAERTVADLAPGQRQGSWLFPPFNFSYRVDHDRWGHVSYWDDLPDQLGLVCLPYAWSGEYLPFDSESFAAAWAVLRFAHRPVLCRPGRRDLFAADPAWRSAGFEPLGPEGLTQARTTLSMIVCRSQCWADARLPAPLEAELADYVLSIGPINGETLAYVTLGLGDADTPHRAVADVFPAHVFLRHRERIAASLNETR